MIWTVLKLTAVFWLTLTAAGCGINLGEGRSKKEESSSVIVILICTIINCIIVGRALIG